MISWVPFAVLNLGSSRHLRETGLTSVPCTGFHCWLAPPEQVYSWTGALLAALLIRPVAEARHQVTQDFPGLVIVEAAQVRPAEAAHVHGDVGQVPSDAVQLEHRRQRPHARGAPPGRCPSR